MSELEFCHKLMFMTVYVFSQELCFNLRFAKFWDLPQLFSSSFFHNLSFGKTLVFSQFLVFSQLNIFFTIGVLFQFEFCHILVFFAQLDFLFLI